MAKRVVTPTEHADPGRSFAASTIFMVSNTTSPISKINIGTIWQQEKVTRLLSLSDSLASLEQSTLEDVETHYVALSYGCDSSAFEESFEYCRRNIAVIASLHSVLCPGSQCDAVPYLWCDTVCIGQAQTCELRIQLEMMNRIFSSASKVIAELEPNEESLDEAIEAFEHSRGLQTDGREIQPIDSSILQNIPHQAGAVTSLNGIGLCPLFPPSVSSQFHSRRRPHFSESCHYRSVYSGGANPSSEPSSVLYENDPDCYVCRLSGDYDKQKCWELLLSDLLSRHTEISRTAQHKLMEDHPDIWLRLAILSILACFKLEKDLHFPSSAPFGWSGLRSKMNLGQNQQIPRSSLMDLSLFDTGDLLDAVQQSALNWAVCCLQSSTQRLLRKTNLAWLRTKTISPTMELVCQFARRALNKATSPRFAHVQPMNNRTTSPRFIHAQPMNNRYMRLGFHVDQTLPLKEQLILTACQCVAWSFRPLQALELYDALRIAVLDEKQQYLADPEFASFSLNDVMSLCEHFLEKEDSGTVNFTEPHRRSFFFSRDFISVNKLPDRHEFMARICLEILHITDPTSILKIPSSDSESGVVSVHGFHNYAAEYWHEHYRIAESSNHDLPALLHQLIVSAIPLQLEGLINRHGFYAHRNNVGLELCILNDFKVLGSFYIQMGADMFALGSLTKETLLLIALFERPDMVVVFFESGRDTHERGRDCLAYLMAAAAEIHEFTPTLPDKLGNVYSDITGDPCNKCIKVAERLQEFEPRCGYSQGIRFRSDGVYHGVRSSSIKHFFEGYAGPSQLPEVPCKRRRTLDWEPGFDSGPECPIHISQKSHGGKKAKSRRAKIGKLFRGFSIRPERVKVNTSPKNDLRPGSTRFPRFAATPDLPQTTQWDPNLRRNSVPWDRMSNKRSSY